VISPKIPESELLVKLRDGDNHAFTTLYNGYSTTLMAHLTHMLKSAELADEVLQDTFMAVWNNRHTIDPEQSFKAYVYKIATNNTYKLFRKAAYDQTYRVHMLPILEAGYNNIESRIYQKEHEELLARLLDKMPAKQREVYRLHKIEGYSYKEISEQLGISHNTINSYITRGNQYIKSQLLTNPEFLPIVLCGLLAC
jgi:RNA polymerase sigma-70 factor (family 1)